MDRTLTEPTVTELRGEGGGEPGKLKICKSGQSGLIITDGQLSGLADIPWETDLSIV